MSGAVSDACLISARRMVEKKPCQSEYPLVVEGEIQSSVFIQTLFNTQEESIQKEGSKEYAGDSDKACAAPLVRYTQIKDNASEEEDELHNTASYQGSLFHSQHRDLNGKSEQSGSKLEVPSGSPTRDKVVPNAVQTPSDSAETSEPWDNSNSKGKHFAEDILGSTVEGKRGTSVNLENRSRPCSRPKKRCFKRNKPTHCFTRREEVGTAIPGVGNKACLIESISARRMVEIPCQSEYPSEVEEMIEPFQSLVPLRKLFNMQEEITQNVGSKEYAGGSDKACSTPLVRCMHDKDKTLQAQVPETLVGSYISEEKTNLRPCSRSKKKCSKRLRHPSKLHRKEGFLKAQLDYSAKKGEGQIFTRSEKVQANKKERKCQIGDFNSKPSSRSKRRCRFGPRARRKHEYKLRKQDTTFLDASHSPLEKNKDTFVGRTSGDTQNTQKEHATPPVFVKVQTLPDRVTFQPGFKARRTPFDHYKKKEVVSGQEFDSSKKAAERLGISVQQFEVSLTEEIDELLGEIDASRREALHASETDTSRVCELSTTCGAVATDTQTLKAKRTNLISELPFAYLAKGVSLPEGFSKNDPFQAEVTPCCRFEVKVPVGHKAKRGRERVRTSIPVRRDLPPSPPPFRTSWSSYNDEQVKASFQSVSDQIGSTFRDPPGRILLEFPPVDENVQVVLPDRPSICHFSPALGSPFSRYLGLPVSQSRPPPFRPVHERLGLSEGAFGDLLKAEIDEVLLASEEYRRSSEESECALPPTLESMPNLVLLSKEDCLKMIRRQSYPSCGSMLGVYWWAADLFRTRFNFDFDFAKDDLSILNAYD